MDAVLLKDGDVYGASAGRPFQSLEHAQQLIAEVPEAADATAVEIQPHTLSTVAPDETHDSTGATGIPGLRAQETTAGSEAPAHPGSPDGTLRDPDQGALLAVLLDGQNVLGAAHDGAEETPYHSTFGELAKAKECAERNGATHLTAVEVQPFDLLLVG